MEVTLLQFILALCFTLMYASFWADSNEKHKSLYLFACGWFGGMAFLTLSELLTELIKVIF